MLIDLGLGRSCKVAACAAGDGPGVVGPLVRAPGSRADVVLQRHGDAESGLQRVAQWIWLAQVQIDGHAHRAGVGVNLSRHAHAGGHRHGNFTRTGAVHPERMALRRTISIHRVNSKKSDYKEAGIG